MPGKWLNAGNKVARSSLRAIATKFIDIIAVVSLTIAQILLRDCYREIMAGDSIVAIFNRGMSDVRKCSPLIAIKSIKLAANTML